MSSTLLRNFWSDSAGVGIYLKIRKVTYLFRKRTARPPHTGRRKVKAFLQSARASRHDDCNCNELLEKICHARK